MNASKSEAELTCVRLQPEGSSASGFRPLRPEHQAPARYAGFVVETTLEATDSDLLLIRHRRHGEMMCIKTCIKMSKKDSAGLKRIPLDC
jgi:hypothetical protein